jgi:D-amino-acid dehydrogenase
MSKYIVIGAGILGAATGYHLAKSGVDVTIVDRDDLGQATDAAAGMICPWLSQRRNKAWYFLAKNGAAYYPKLIQQLTDEGETETGYRQVGAISLHKDIEKLEKMQERAIKRRDDAPEMGDIVMLTPEETFSRFPLLDKEYAGVFVSGAARVDGQALRQALVRAAVKNGAKFIKGSAELDYNGQYVSGVKVGEETIAADKVIIAAGAWADELLSP